MAFACGGGILLGAIVGSLPRPRVLIMPMVSSLYAVPLGDPLSGLHGVARHRLGSKIAFASIYGFLPTMLSTAAGIQTIDPQLLLAARSMGATLSQRLVRVIIPAAIPTVLSGLRVGGALVIVGVVVSEMLISSRRHRLSDLALPHHSRQPACVRRRAAGAGHGGRLQRRDPVDRAQGRDLADRYPAPASARRRDRAAPRCSRRPEGASVFDLTLTFDNGPEPDVTPRVLDILARARHQDHLLRDRREARAIPSAAGLRRVRTDEGHWIGNHTFTHSRSARPAARSRDGRARSAGRKTRSAISRIPRRWFRPFGGGGNLDERLLKPSVVDYLAPQQAQLRALECDPARLGRSRGLDRARARAVPLAALEPDGAARSADRRDGPSRSAFSTAPRRAGARFARTFRPHCVPIRSGEIVLPIERLCFLHRRKCSTDEDCEFHSAGTAELRHRHRRRRHRRRASG